MDRKTETQEGQGLAQGHSAVRGGVQAPAIQRTLLGLIREGNTAQAEGDGQPCLRDCRLQAWDGAH